ncbi:outer membrane beta-barrel protein [Porifericola rhodea]|uniref:outer membrane beta-barrel protein n=1 Tax=Porifericola rhodea TaxID=930972 RepID=UPI0026660DE7|nr:outer membrane beta-barrel protein [Porifericola rhodea]WKN29858.1 outer membrane beta-barrel protein [Porifericola rhodea]
MKKFIPLLSLILFALPVSAQELSWSLHVAPGISYRLAQQQALSDYAQTVQLGEKSMYVFDFGFGLQKSVSKRLDIATAINYSQKGFSNIHVSAVYQASDLNRRYTIDFVQDYLELPFYLTYSVMQNDKFELYPLLGITNSLLLYEKNKVSTRSGEASAETIQLLSQPYLKSKVQHNLGAIGGIGIEGKVDPQTAIGLEAISKIMLTPLEDHFSQSRRYLYSFNLNFKFVRKIR